MIVGGTGIASAVLYLQDHLRRTCDGPHHTNEKTRIREIELVWTAKQSALLRDIARRELAPVLAREDFRASLYTTGASIEPPPQDLNELGCTIQTGRPHLQSLIMRRACDASASDVSLVILVCGPAGPMKHVR
jgi:ferric-chelate reductase